jgi:hypothetical protein
MGFVIKQALETNQGLLSEAYVRIEMYRVEVFYGVLHATVAMYPSRQAAMETVPEYFGEVNPNPSQVVGVSLVYKGEEIEYPTYFQFPMIEPVEIEVPRFEEVTEVITSTYYDFDDNGNIVEQTRETEKIKTVQTGTETITKYKISVNKNEGKVYEFAYGLVKEEFGKIFGDENIIDE